MTQMVVLLHVGPADHFVHVKWNAPLDFKRTLKFLQFPNGEERFRYGCGIHRVFDCLLNQDHWVVRMKTAGNANSYNQADERPVFQRVLFSRYKSMY